MTLEAIQSITNTLDFISTCKKLKQL